MDIPLSTISGNQFIEQWYPLQIPSGFIPTGKEKSQRLQDGSFNIRIKAKYQAIEILPIDSYLHLQEVNRVFFSLGISSDILVHSTRLSSTYSYSRTTYQSS